MNGRLCHLGRPFRFEAGRALVVDLVSAALRVPESAFPEDCMKSAIVVIPAGAA